LALLNDLVLADWTRFTVPPNLDWADEEDPVANHGWGGETSKERE
jgi:hypothetical protein